MKSLRQFGRALRPGGPTEAPAEIDPEAFGEVSDGHSGMLANEDKDSGPRRPPKGKSMLFCIGAQKAGTTWLSSFLGAHPDCHFAAYKEMHFFDAVHGDVRPMIRWQINILRNRVDRLYRQPRPRLGAKLDAIQEAAEMLDMYRLGRAGERAYMRLLLRHCGESRYLCDFTPDYAYMPRDVFETMASYGERPRFIFILRDPVSRLWSQVRMRLGRMDLGDEDRAGAARAMVEEWMAEGPLSRRPHNDYAHTVSMLETCVPEEDRLELFMDDLFRQETADRICRFLDIPTHVADFAPEHVGSPLELPADLRAAMRESLDETYRFVAERYGTQVPERWAAKS